MKADGITNQGGSGLRNAGERRACTLLELLVVIAVIGILSGRGIAQTYDGFGYSVSGTNITITNFTGSDRAITIPSSIPGVNGTVTSIGDYAFTNGGLTSVTIPGSVASIGESAFSGCTSMTNVTIGNGVTSIGDQAFDLCSLTSVAIPDSVSFIGTGAFESCRALTSVTIGNGVTSIASSAFFDCSLLRSVTIPNSVTSIGDYAFAFSPILISVTIPDSVISLGEGAFEECGGLSTLTIPNGVASIGNATFASCGGLTSVTLGNGVTNVGSGAFEGCSALTAAYFQGDAPSGFGGNVFFRTAPSFAVYYPPAASGWSTPTWDGIPAYPLSDGFECGISGTDVTIVGYAGPGGSVTIPSSIPGLNGTVRAIGASAFYWCSSLTSVTIPSTVTNIGDSAFAFSRNLSGVAIPSSVSTIPSEAFYECSDLTSVTIPSSVTAIGSEAFYECSRLLAAYFQGNAPSGFGGDVFEYTAASFCIFYPSTASGWSTPTWKGYAAQPYAYRPVNQQPVLTLTLGAGAVSPSFNHLELGTNYQLQVSSDLSTWSNAGPVFTATHGSAVYAQPFNVGDLRCLFFRLVSTP